MIYAGIEVIANPYLKKNEVYMVNSIRGKQQIVRWIFSEKSIWKKTFNRRNKKWEIIKKAFKEQP